MLFFKKTEVCNFADDATINSSSLNYEEVHKKLSDSIDIIANWFQIISMVASPGKFQISLGLSINNNNITFIAENKDKKH